jgi:hypothetical protein
MVDLAMQNYYNPAISYFESLDDRVKSLLNKKVVVLFWIFCRPKPPTLNILECLKWFSTNFNK